MHTETPVELFYWPTPNGHKITIFLEETGTPYKITPVKIGEGEQFKPEFLAINPNHKIPAIIDPAPGDGSGPLSIFESGAILQYLAEKTGQYLPSELRPRYQVLQWLNWQMGGLGPMAGQNHHFSHYVAEKVPYAEDRYVNETSRLYVVLDRQLQNQDFIAGDYSIADMACYPWVVPWKRQQQNLDDFPDLKAWFERMRNRSAVITAYEKGKEISDKNVVNEESKKLLFGQSADFLRRYYQSNNKP